MTEKFDLSKYIKPLILDGAIGSMLQQIGFVSDPYLWTCYVNFKSPNRVKEIHKKYILAGADIITTNTFRTNPLVIERSNYGLNVSKAVKDSVSISKCLAEEYSILLAGSNPPAEDCYQSERNVNLNKLVSNHHQHIDLLYNNGVDFILNETQSHFDEIKIITKYCSTNKIPFIISLYIKNDLRILSGEHITEIIDYIIPYNPIGIMFNCIDKFTFNKLIEISFNFNWGYYLNCGTGNVNDSNIECGISPNNYVEIVKHSLNLKPKIIGSCCGSNPNHTKAIRDFIDGKFNS